MESFAYNLLTEIEKIFGRNILSEHISPLLGTTVFCTAWNFEPSCGICQFRRNFYFFCRISQNSVLAGDKGTNTAYFGSGLGGHRKLIGVCRHNCAMKYITATRALMAGILLMLKLCELLSVYLQTDCICQLQ